MKLPSTAQSGHPELTAAQRVRLAAEAMAAKKGFDIVAYNVGGVSSLTDFFLVASALNNPHLKALYNDVRQALKEQGVNCWRASGNQESGWMLADYGDFIVHIFKKEVRDYYRVDALWQDAPKLDLEL